MRKPGQVVLIDLGDGTHSYGIILREPLVAFFDRRFTTEKPAPSFIIGLPIAFTLMVMNYAITKGRWVVVGQVAVPEELEVPPAFCKQDQISGELSIYQELPELRPSYERRASADECFDLEAAAVWDPEHVEDRLRDHFEGRPNQWVDQLKPTLHGFQ